MAAPSRAALLICNTLCCDVNSDRHRLLQIHTLAAMGITSALQGTGMHACVVKSIDRSSAVRSDSYFRFGEWDLCTFFRNPICKQQQHVDHRFHLSRVNRVEL